MKNIILSLSPEEAAILLSAVDYQQYTMLEEWGIEDTVPPGVPPEIVEHVDVLEHLGETLASVLGALEDEGV
jgi:hypothetical protein